MFWRLRRFLILAAVSGMLIIWGVQTLQTALRNRTPTVRSMNDFAGTHTDAKWLELSDCTLAIEHAVPGHLHEIFIPVYGSRDEAHQRIDVVMVTDDDTLMKLQESLAASDREARRALVQTNRALLTNRTLKGVVRHGMGLDDRDVSKLGALGPTLSRGFIVVEDGRKPRVLGGVILLLAGLVIAAFLLRPLVIWLRARRAGSAPPVAPKASAGTG